MAFTKLEKDMNIIQKLDDEPNDAGGMTSAELKAKFDEGNNAMKEWINNTFIPEAERELNSARLESLPKHAHLHSASGTDPITPHMIGALPIIDARSADYDMDVILQSGRHCAMYETSSVTLGTPFNKGVTAFVSCTILSYANNNMYGSQFAFMSGNIIYVRKMSNSVIGDWVSLATTDYAVNKAGDKMTGYLENTSDNSDGVGRFAGTKNGAYLVSYYGDVTKQRQLVVCNSNNIPDFRNSLRYVDIETGNNDTILHTGNKPSGSYTGNGDAAERVIDTGGIGNYLMLSNSVTTSIVGPDGALSFNASTGTITTHGPSEARFLSGVLTMRSAHADLNYLSYGYYYQVL